MKISKYLTLIFVLFSSVCFSQDLLLEFKFDYCVNTPKFSGPSVLTDNSGGSEANFSFGASARVYKDLYIKTSLGTNDYNLSFDLEWPEDKSASGYGSMDQIYLEFLPEIRLLEGHLFINTGFGFNKVIDRSWNFSEDEIGFFSSPEKMHMYFAANVGFNYRIKDIGFIVEVGYKNFRNIFEFNPGGPSFGIDHLRMSAGLSYVIK